MQTHPGNSRFLMEAFRLATEEEDEEDAHKWLVCDFTPFCPERYRYRKTIVCPSPKIVFYLPKKDDSAKDKKGAATHK